MSNHDYVDSHDQYSGGGGGAKVTACFHNTEQTHVFYIFY